MIKQYANPSNGQCDNCAVLVFVWICKKMAKIVFTSVNMPQSIFPFRMYVLCTKNTDLISHNIFHLVWVNLVDWFHTQITNTCILVKHGIVYSQDLRCLQMRYRVLQIQKIQLRLILVHLPIPSFSLPFILTIPWVAAISLVFLLILANVSQRIQQQIKEQQSDYYEWPTMLWLNIYTVTKTSLTKKNP